MDLEVAQVAASTGTKHLKLHGDAQDVIEELLHEGAPPIELIEDIVAKFHIVASDLAT